MRAELNAARKKAATEVQVETLQEVKTLRAELKAALVEATEANAHGKTKMALQVAEAAEGEELDKQQKMDPSAKQCCVVL